jgi:hypothetical protein
MMKDHYDFYRDNFINDRVGFEPMFPKTIPRFVGWLSRAMAKERYKE